MKALVFSHAAWVLLLALVHVVHSATCLPAFTANTTYIGCYVDPVSPRDLPGPMLTAGNSNSPQYCADICGAAGYAYSGVEFTV